MRKPEDLSVGEEVTFVYDSHARVGTVCGFTVEGWVIVRPERSRPSDPDGGTITVSKSAARKIVRVPVPSVTKIDVAFPAHVKWVPPMADIPEMFRRPDTKQGRFFMELFAGRNGGVVVSQLGMMPRKGVNPEAAWNALQCVLGTFSIQMEHKEAAFAYLCSEWFSDIRWQTKNGTVEPFDDADLEAAWLEKLSGG